MTSQPRKSNMGQSVPPIKLPLPPGKVLVFDCITGKVYVADSFPGSWGSPA